MALASGRILVWVLALASGRILVLVPTLALHWGISTRWASRELVGRIMFAGNPHSIDYLVMAGVGDGHHVKNTSFSIYLIHRMPILGVDAVFRSFGLLASLVADLLRIYPEFASTDRRNSGFGWKLGVIMGRSP